MSFPFLLFRPFSLFRSHPLGQSSAPRVTINALGEATITCRPIPAPRVVIDADGLATVSCSDTVVAETYYLLVGGSRIFCGTDVITIGAPAPAETYYLRVGGDRVACGADIITLGAPV